MPEPLEPDLRAALLRALAWQVEPGADEAIGDAPVDRFDREAPRRARPGGRHPPPRRRRPPAGRDRGARRRLLRPRGAEGGHGGLRGLRARLGARNLVFADGNPAARLMVIGEAPGREEDIAGLPFVGRSGQLLDRMLAAIGLSRRAEDPAHGGLHHQHPAVAAAAEPRASADEVAMLLPFLHRHIELKAPEVLLLVGAAAVRTLMQTGDGITRMRGRWLDWRGRPGDRHLPSGGSVARRAEEARGLGRPPGLKARLDAGR